MTKISLVLLAQIIFGLPAFAGPDRVSLLFGSHHVNANRDFEAFNPGIFVTWKHAGRTSHNLGLYRNSFGRLSASATLSYRFWEIGETQLNLVGGIAHYPGNGRKTPFSIGDLIPVGGIEIRHQNLFALVLPGDLEITDAVLAFGIEIYRK